MGAGGLLEAFGFSDMFGLKVLLSCVSSRISFFGRGGRRMEWSGVCLSACSKEEFKVLRFTAEAF